MKVWQEQPNAKKLEKDNCLGYAKILTKEIVDPRSPFKVMWKDLRNIDPREKRYKNGDYIPAENIPEKYDGEMLLLSRFVPTNPLHLDVDLPSISAYRDYSLRMTSQLIDSYGLVIRLGLYDPNRFMPAVKKPTLAAPALLSTPAPQDLSVVKTRYEFYRDRWEACQLGTSREDCVRIKMLEQWKLFFYKWLFPQGTKEEEEKLKQKQTELLKKDQKTSRRASG